MTGNSLQQVEQQTVKFYEDSLIAIRASDGRIYASVSQMCAALGLDAQGQRRRMERHTVLSKGVKGVDNLATPGGPQSAHVLRADLIPLWLSGVRVKSVRKELREKLERFQEEAAAVLWEAFQGGRLTTDPTFAELMRQDLPEVDAVIMARAVLQLAENQLILRGRVDEIAVSYGKRLEAIEATLGDPGRHITPAQAASLSQAVKAVAMALSNISKRNEYGGVYGEMYRRYEIPSYRELPAEKFDDAMSWLNEWLQSLTGNGF